MKAAEDKGWRIRETMALERGIPPRVVQSYLGHSTIDMTMNIYTHVTAELEKEEIRKLANQF